jgi:hypothetical protein
MRKDSKSHAEAGRKGAAAFWKKFYNDRQFQEKMRKSWEGHRVNRQKIIEAAKLGYKAFRKRYDSDAVFRRQMDEKLAISRSKGGTISLRNLGEEGFKKRFEEMRNSLLKYKYTDNNGNRLRSWQELKVANLLSLNGISYTVEPLFLCGPRTFFPDFLFKVANKK